MAGPTSTGRSNFNRVEVVERVHENPAGIGGVRVSGHAQPVRLVDLAYVPVDHIVTDVVPPLDHLSGVQA